MGNEVQIVTKKRTKSIIFVLFSNIISLVSGILIGFIVPKMMDLNNYGIYKIYTLYITYLPIFHFGFATGIYIKYGGCDYNELDKNRFRSYFKYLFLLQFVISLVFIVFSLIFSSNEYRFIIIMLSFLLISNNLTNYFQLISQITERYFELSIRNILLSLCNIVLIVFYFILDKFTDFQLTCYTYIISSIIINYVLTIWYIITYRNIIFGKSEKVSAKELINIHWIGIPVLISGLFATLIINIDRQFVSILFGTEDYAIYAFAYTILTIVNTCISAVSTVLYPSLKRLNRDSFINSYDSIFKVFLYLSLFCLCGYFVIGVIINFILPKYNDSIGYLYVIFPSAIFTGLITIVNHNYYKVLNKNWIYLILSSIIFVISIIANLIAYYSFGTMISISIASIICMFLWYLLTSAFLPKDIKNKSLKYSIIIIGFIAIYYLIGYFIKNYYVSFSIYLLIYFLFIIIFEHDNISNFYRKRKKKNVDL